MHFLKIFIDFLLPENPARREEDPTQAVTIVLTITIDEITVSDRVNLMRLNDWPKLKD